MSVEKKAPVEKGKPELNFDGMCWPNPNDPLSLSWILRHGTAELTSYQRNIAASYITAYQHLIDAPQKERNKIIEKMKSLEFKPRSPR